MQVSIASAPGGETENEDWVGCTPCLAIILDGLSTFGLSTGCRHGVPWYVHNLGSNLLTILDSNSVISLTDALGSALEKVASLHPECDLKNPGTPSSTVSILRERYDHFDYLVLADSPIIFKSGSDYSVITDLRVDQVLPELKAEVDSLETGTTEHTDGVKRLVRAQRQIRNTPDGYWIAAASAEAAAHAIIGQVSRDLVQAAAVMSDGASRAITEYEVLTWSNAFKLLGSSGPMQMIASVRAAEATDPFGHCWPRCKCGDDATIAYCTISAKLE